MSKYITDEQLAAKLRRQYRELGTWRKVAALPEYAGHTVRLAPNIAAWLRMIANGERTVKDNYWRNFFGLVPIEQVEAWPKKETNRAPRISFTPSSELFAALTSEAADIGISRDAYTLSLVRRGRGARE